MALNLLRCDRDKNQSPHPNMQIGANNRGAGKGCYTLVISLPKTRWLRIGKLGAARFPRGTYFYTGSAMGGLRARISHHVRKRNKKNHWHIDYLLRSRGTCITKVWIYPATHRECRQNQKLAALLNAKVIMKGFGASDCASGCASHLLFVAREATRQSTKSLNITEIQYSQKKKGRYGNNNRQS